MTDDPDLNPEEVQHFLESSVNDIAAKYGTQLGNFPEPPDKDSMLKFLRDVVAEENPGKLTRTANFREEETGRTKVPVLAYHHIARYAASEGHTVVRDYLLGKAGDIATVSMGRKFKLMETTFTVRRETKNLGTPRETRKRGFLGTETTVREGMES